MSNSSNKKPDLAAVLVAKTAFVTPGMMFRAE
jgi:hypothetical protein